MFSLKKFGMKLKNIRKSKRITQSEVSSAIGVSEQAVSKWENGECLPDVWNLIMLGRLFRMTIDDLLDVESENIEKVTDTIKIGKANFEVVERPETILAGKLLYVKDFRDMDAFNAAIESVSINEEKTICSKVTDPALPVRDIHLSANFWLEEKTRAFGFVRETSNALQAEDVDIFRLPASQYIRAYNDKATAELLAKEECDIWELFAYIRNYVMPAYGFKMAENGAQELEVFDTPAHKSGYAYMPVMRKM